MSKYPNRLSEISLMNDLVTDTNLSFSQNGGGLFDMFTSKPQQSVSTDNYGRTILHCLVTNPTSLDLLNDKYFYDKFKSLANIQDSQGNTPAIIAASMATKTNDKRFNQIIDVLVEKYGADLTVKNKNGEFVGIETEYSPQNQKTDKNQTLSSDMSEIPNFMTDMKPIGVPTEQLVQAQKGGCGCEKNYTEDLSLTDYLKHNVLGMSHSKISRSYKGKGGAIAGQRKLYDENSDVIEDNQNQLKRLADKQGEEIHKRVKDKIRDLLTKNKKKFPKIEINDETVNAFKAALWDKVKIDYQDLTKNLDKSIKLEELTTIDNLKSIDIEKWIDTLRKYYAEKDEKRKSMNNTPKRTIATKAKRDISDTSDNSLEDLDLQDISATSTSD